MLRILWPVRVLFPLLVLTSVAAQEVKWWEKTFEEALTAAADSKAKMLLLYCYANTGDCQGMWADTMTEKSMQPLLLDFVCMGANQDDAAGKQLIERFHATRLPTVFFLQPDGAIVDLTAGYYSGPQFKTELQRIRGGTDTVPAMRAGVAKAPDDLALQLRLAEKLRAIGSKDEAAKVIAAVVAKDPKSKTEAGALAMLQQLFEQTFKPELAPDYDLKPLKEFLIKQKSKRVLFLGYDKLAAIEDLRGNLKEACEAAMRAWKNIPPDQVLDWGQNIACKAYVKHKELDRGQLKLALEISAKALAEVEADCKKRPDDAVLANALYIHAQVQIVNNLRKEAFASMERAMQLNPKNESLGKALERWKSGEK